MHPPFKPLKSKTMKTIKKLSALAAILLLGGALNAQVSLGEIRGTVKDEATQETMPEAIVRISRGGQVVSQTLTDLDGKFTAKSLTPGAYSVDVLMVGMDTLHMSGVTVEGDKITWLNDLAISEKSLKTYIFVEYEIPLIKPEDPSAQTLSYKELENNPNIREMSKLLGSITTDFKTGIDGGDAYVRGARSDATVYFVDGVKSRGGATIPGTAIGRVTVYTGGVPAKYGDTTGGVVILETKSYFDLYNDHMNR
jgi:hypothetical protein